jgi:hypothetical protein
MTSITVPAPPPPSDARVVVAEILDNLPHDDPRAVAGRRDLRRVNAVMGNPCWFRRVCRKHEAAAKSRIVEIGAGDGRLAGQLARRFPATMVTALDLAPRPPHDLPENLRWVSGDLFAAAGDLFPAAPGTPPAGMLAACLFLHHFEGERLEWIGRHLCPAFEVCAFVEPDRRLSAHLLGRLAWPWLSEVTRHDMHVSINAGFRAGELPALLGLNTPDWQITESTTAFGVRRLIARQRESSRATD